MFPEYDVIVVGAGHAGCEAAAAAAKLGSSVLLITMNMHSIAQMSCNPAMGGIAKGQIVREIDALGGHSGVATDETMIQFRMLNRSKGVSVWSPRAQSDRVLFSLKWRSILEGINGLDFFQDKVVGLLVKDDAVYGVKSALGHSIKSKTVILTNGTFLNGIIYIGKEKQAGGRIGEDKASGITEQLMQIGFESGRLKTGTPPRIDGRTIDYSKLEEQKGDPIISGFSFRPTKKIAPEMQLSCHIAYTNQEVHRILKTGFDESPMFSGEIEGVGPRYCPSIEDKIGRFADKDRHQLFVEPEGFNTVEVYLNGFSTSLPQEVQLKALRRIEGLEHCKIFRPGYAIEYDFFPPTQLSHSLETRLAKNLFFAGQINGTTGYEEAACQGLMAGINAHRKAKGAPPFVLKRDEAYIGVLIDDLINKGTQEPYRMFTSRAEYRTLLRQDNADLRLTALAHSVGMADEQTHRAVLQKKERISTLIQKTREASVHPEEINALLIEKGSTPIREKTKWGKIFSRPEISLLELKGKIKSLDALFASRYTAEEIEQVEINIKYQPYIDREKEIALKMRHLEDATIPSHFNYEKIISLGTEAKEKLKSIRPTTLGQAARISGIKPTDISILSVYIGR